MISQNHSHSQDLARVIHDHPACSETCGETTCLLPMPACVITRGTLQLLRRGDRCVHMSCYRYLQISASWSVIPFRGRDETLSSSLCVYAWSVTTQTSHHLLQPIRLPSTLRRAATTRYSKCGLPFRPSEARRSQNTRMSTVIVIIGILITVIVVSVLFIGWPRHVDFHSIIITTACDSIANTPALRYAFGRAPRYRQAPIYDIPICKIHIGINPTSFLRHTRDAHSTSLHWHNHAVQTLPNPAYLLDPDP